MEVRTVGSPVVQVLHTFSLETSCAEATANSEPQAASKAMNVFIVNGFPRGASNCSDQKAHSPSLMEILSPLSRPPTPTNKFLSHSPECVESTSNSTDMYWSLLANAIKLRRRRHSLQWL